MATHINTRFTLDEVCDDCGEYGSRLFVWSDAEGDAYLCEDCHPQFHRARLGTHRDLFVPVAA